MPQENPPLSAINSERLFSETAAPGRECGDCSVCCILPEIGELAKPPRVACLHLSNGKCSCYDKRPSACRAFNCLWLRGALSSPDVSWRPDLSGVLLDAYLSIPTGERRIVASEVWAGALDSEGMRELLAGLALFGQVAIYYRDGRQSLLSADVPDEEASAPV